MAKLIAREVICPECDKRVKKMCVKDGSTGKIERITYYCPKCSYQKIYEGEEVRKMLDPVPSMDELEGWLFDGVCEATDGCMVEPDGYCPHGCPSWLIKVGIH